MLLQPDVAKSKNSLLMDIWSRKMHNPCSSKIQKQQQKQQTQLDSDKIIISRQQLLQFTKKFAMSKIDYEQKINQITSELEDKKIRIESLTQQVNDLRTQQQYLMKVMEQLRDRHINQVSALNIRNESNNKVKQSQIQYLKNQIVKIKLWLQEQKLEAKRCLQFIKIKDQIISNLQWQVIKIKDQLKQNKQKQYQNFESIFSRKNQNILNNLIKNKQENQVSRKQYSTKRVILRKQRKKMLCQSQKQNKKEDKIICDSVITQKQDFNLSNIVSEAQRQENKLLFDYNSVVNLEKLSFQNLDNKNKNKAIPEK